jgi:Holliday junction resolvase
MGKAEPRKARTGEREIVRAYTAAGFSAWRTPNSGGLRLKGDVHGVPGLHIEVKRTEALRIWEALDQAASEAKAGAVPALHFRRNRSGWFVAVPLVEFIALLQQARGAST